MKVFLTILMLFILPQLSLAGIMEDFDSLGGNDELLERAIKLNPEKEVEVVQNRIVDRYWRHEFSPEYIAAFGGDAYLDTQAVGLTYHLHITPKWTLGLRYSYSFNDISIEGQKLIEEENLIPQIDFPLETYMATANWYPIYGKMNLHDLGIIHFDIYLLGGYGQVKLQSGRTPTYTAGGGLGMWFSQHLTTRLEIRHLTYKAQRFEGEDRINMANLSVSIGLLL